MLLEHVLINVLDNPHLPEEIAQYIVNELGLVESIEPEEILTISREVSDTRRFHRPPLKTTGIFVTK
jgi:hypothetical protein